MSDNISRLKGADKIRKRVGVMLGSDDVRGVQQTLFEIMSNSIDRFKAGHGNTINITKHKDLSYTVEDFADGLPMVWNNKENAYNWELTTRILYAGGNYDTTKDSHVGQLGINGLGLASSILSSDSATVISHRDGFEYEVRYSKGRPIHKITGEYICDDGEALFSKVMGEKVLLSTKTNKATGTKIWYKPDLDVFTDTDIPIEWIKDKCKKQAVVNKGLTINIYDEVASEEFSYLYKNGIHDYAQELITDNMICDAINIDGDGVGRDREDKDEYKVSYEMSMAFSADKGLIECYHNSSELIHGGSPLKAIELATVNTIHNHIKSQNLYSKNETRIRWIDIEDSLISVISSYSSTTSYSNQTKTSIDNKFIQDFINESIKEKLNVFMIENPIDANKIANQILVNKRSRERSERTRVNIKKKLGDGNHGILNKIPNLIECQSKNTDENILCICEGKSSLGSILSGRRDVHAIFPLRGKILNCLKASDDRIFSSDIIVGLIQALGCGVTIKSKNKDIMKFDESKLRYSKVFILVDQDQDGVGSILPLLLTVFYKLMPELIEQGRIYLCETPKYEIVCSDDTELYAINDDEYESITSKLTCKFDTHYIKGLAELNEDSIAMCLEEGYKNLKQLRMDDVEKSIERLELWMGDKIEPRRDYIMDNFDTVGGSIKI